MPTVAKWNLEGYQRVYAVVTQFLKLTSSVPRSMALIEEELDNFIKQETGKS
jgi:hypothetical protein